MIQIRWEVLESNKYITVYGYIEGEKVVKAFGLIETPNDLGGIDWYDEKDIRDFSSLFISNKIGYLAYVRILKNKYYKLKIGSAAIKKLEKEFNDRGINELYLEAQPIDNNISLNDLILFYKKLGYEEYRKSSDNGMIMYKI